MDNNNKELFRVEWSNVYDAYTREEALAMALADLETAIKFRQGATGFFVSDEFGVDGVLIDIEYNYPTNEDDQK